MQNIEKPVLKMLKVNLGVKANDKILVITDNINKKITNLAKEVYSIIKKRYSASFHIYKATTGHGAEPDKKTAKIMKKYPVLIMLNYYSLSHTKARANANKTGSRIASMPGFTREMFYKNNAMDQDYKKINKITQKLNKILSKAKKAIITSNNGTNLQLKLGRLAEPDGGFIKRGECDNLPSGESFVSPITGSGILIINPRWHEKLKHKLIFQIKEGKIIDIKSKDQLGKKFKKDFFAKSHRRMLAELGIGTNPGARNPSNTLEAEKIMGTIHIAFGDSSHFGGKNVSDRHQDFILNKPTLFLDKRKIIEKGKFLLK